MTKGGGMRQFTVERGGNWFGDTWPLPVVCVVCVSRGAEVGDRDRLERGGVVGAWRRLKGSLRSRQLELLPIQESVARWIELIGKFKDR